MSVLLPRRNNPAELKAFEGVCQRLAGFDAKLRFEWVDGYLSALAAGPQLPPVEEWLSALCGDAFERAFADPSDHAQALRAIKARLSVLLDQLDPEALFEHPDQVRLEPLLAEWTDAHRADTVAKDGLRADDAQALQSGALWAAAFVAAVADFPDLWVDPGPAVDDEAAAHYAALFDHVGALLLLPGSEPYLAHLAQCSPEHVPSRDDLIDAACVAVQDLRLWWVDQAPRPETRHVEPKPGRNDPCPCGSGKKYKKCHGAG